MSTLTVLNPGTGFMRDATDVVGNLTHLVDGREGIDWMVTAGVAAKGTQNFPRLRTGAGGNVDVSRTQPGMLDPITNKATKASLAEQDKRFPALRRGYELGVTPKFGAGSFGLEHNVIRVVWWIQEQMREALAPSSVVPVPTQINMVGWSRGAVTCLRIAEELKQYGLGTPAFDSRERHLSQRIQALRVNIFAMDPVPGAEYGSQMHYYEDTTLSSNVKNFFAVYAEDEARGGMKPLVHTSFDPTTNTVRLRMPGPHDQSVEGGRGSAWSKGLTSVFAITESLCHDWLITNGTRLKNSKILTESQTLEEYGKIQQRLAEYRALQEVGKIVRGGGKALAFVHGASTPGKAVRSAQMGTLPPNKLARDRDHVMGVELLSGKPMEYVNDHHFSLFSRLVPDFGYAAGIKPSEVRSLDRFMQKHQPATTIQDAIRNIGAVSNTRRQVEQINQLKTQFPETYKGLVSMGIIND